MFGFVLGGGCAAWVQRRGTPMSHGVLTTIVAYLGAQSVFIVIRLLRGDSVNWFGVFFTLSLVTLAGLFGGILGSQLQARGFVPSSQRDTSRGRAVSTILVIDVGTTGLRAALVDETLAVQAMEYRACPPSTPAPGLVEFDGADDGDVAARRSSHRAGVAPPSRSPQSASPTSVPARWCGIGRPAYRSGPASAGRTCAPSASASWPRSSTAGRSHRTSRRPRPAGSSPTHPTSTDATCASARSTAGSPGR